MRKEAKEIIGIIMQIVGMVSGIGIILMNLDKFSDPTFFLIWALFVVFLGRITEESNK